MQIVTAETIQTYDLQKLAIARSYGSILLEIHRFQKKPEVTPKRGLIALAVSGNYSKQHGERRRVNLSSDDIPGVSVSEGKIEKLTPSQLKFSLRSRRINLSGKIQELFGLVVREQGSNMFTIVRLSRSLICDKATSSHHF